MRPTTEYKSYLRSVARRLSLSNKYCVVHVRVGDQSATFENHRFDIRGATNWIDPLACRLGGHIEKYIVPAWGRQIVIASDNVDVAERLTGRYGLRRLTGRPIHLGWRASSNDVKHTLTEYFLMANSSAMYQWAALGTSGFSDSVEKIYSVPVYRILC